MFKDTQAQKARLRRLNIRLSQQEWDKVHSLSANTTCRSISEYARKLLLNQPVKVFYRNKSFDEFERMMPLLLLQLDAFGYSFKQLAEKITTQGHIPDRQTIELLLEHEKNFSEKMDVIQFHIAKISDHETQNRSHP